MSLKKKSTIRLKYKIVGDRYVNRVISTRHVEERMVERQIEHQHILECLENGVTKLGKQTEQYKNTPFKNTASVLRDGKIIQLTVVYALIKASDHRYHDVFLITAY